MYLCDFNFQIKKGRSPFYGFVYGCPCAYTIPVAESSPSERISCGGGAKSA